MSESADKTDDKASSPQEGFRREYAYRRPWRHFAASVAFGTWAFVYGIVIIVAVFVEDDPLPVRILGGLAGPIFILIGLHVARCTMHTFQMRRIGQRVLLTDSTFTVPGPLYRPADISVAISDIKQIRLVNWYGKKSLRIKTRRQLWVPDIALSSDDMFDQLVADLAQVSDKDIEIVEYRSGQFSIRSILILTTVVAFGLGLWFQAVPEEWPWYKHLGMWVFIIITYSPFFILLWASLVLNQANVY